MPCSNGEAPNLQKKSYCCFQTPYCFCHSTLKKPITICWSTQKTERKHALSEMLHKQTWKFANREDISRASTIELCFHKFEGNKKLWRYPRSLSFFSGNDLLLSNYARYSHKGTKLILVHNIASMSYSHPRVETFWNKELHQHRLQLHHVCSPTAYTKHHSHMRYIHHLIIIYISPQNPCSWSWTKSVQDYIIPWQQCLTLYWKVLAHNLPCFVVSTLFPLWYMST